MNLRRYLSPFFLIRHYLHNDIKEIVNRYQFDGKILDFGCGQKPFINLFSACREYIGIDYRHFSINKDFAGEKPDTYFDKNYSKTLTLPYKDKSFDHSVSFQVMEHHSDPSKMVSELLRVTKNKGYLLITCPFLFGLHEEPNDYQRFTKHGLIELFKKNNCKIVKIMPEGSVFSVISTILNEYLNSQAGKSKFRYFICSAVYPPFLFFQYLSLVLDKFVKSEQIVLNYLVLAQKP